MKEKIYEAEPITEEPLLDRIDSATIIAWFRCNSCLTCKRREHKREDIVDLVRYLGFLKELAHKNHLKEGR